MKSIIGRKIGMTQVFLEKGNVVPVTIVEAGPCRIIEVKEEAKHGYSAAQVGFIECAKEKTFNKPYIGIFNKKGLPVYKVLREIEIPSETEVKAGDYIKVDIFEKGDKVSVSGITKGKGFQGVMKRHKFKGGPDSHGSMFNRAPGSIGASSFPSRVWRGQRMAGHMGNERTTVRNLTVIDVLPEQNLIMIKGALPGANNSIVEIRKEG